MLFALFAKFGKSQALFDVFVARGKMRDGFAG